MSQSSPTLETLARLSSKPGVKSTLILSRADGAIIKSSGFPAIEAVDTPAEPNSDFRASVQDRHPGSPEIGRKPSGQERQGSPEDIARAVFKYVSEAGKLIEVVGAGEDVQLTRLRTKKQEIVIVPDQNYLMVVIQEVQKTI